MKEQTTETVAHAVLDHLVTTIVVPVRIHSDLGLMFKSEAFDALCSLLRIHKMQPTLYRPHSYGNTEIQENAQGHAG